VKVAAREVERRLEKFKASARAAGVKLTHQRLEIFREVASSLEHPDAETVYRAVQPRMPTVSLDTVYRTLWLLTNLGLVTTLGPRRETVRFDANLHHHHHYVCLRCGLARDFDSAKLNTLRIPDAVEELGSVVATHVEVRGVCKNCAKEKAGESVPDNPKKPQGERRRT
jgi:Fur family transcriptional regulator, peroxide stress response regulator